MTHFAYEPEFEPELMSWESPVKDKKGIPAKEKSMGTAIIQTVETRFPHMAGKLRRLDVATPQTYKRYCHAYRGALMGFWPTRKGKQMHHTGQSKGLNNILLSSQWLQPPGGLPVAVITGKDTIMLLCKPEKKKFVL